MDVQEKIKNRQKANKAIVELLSVAADIFPDYRFHQLLWNVGLIDRDREGYIADKFYEESIYTLDKLKAVVASYSKLDN
jgi:hypothetical protein